MTDREMILARIREALSLAPPSAGGTVPDGPRPAERARQYLPPGGATFEEQLQRFQTLSAELKTEFLLLANQAELNAVLLKIRDREGWNRIASHRGALTEPACEVLGLPVLWTDQGYDVRELENCNAGLTECDALVAQTGSVLVTSRDAGGRALSVLPPHHVVLARQEQLLPDLAAAFARVHQKYAPNFPSMISLITGPSRTGDIERILVLGAHGPKKLTILCV